MTIQRKAQQRQTINLPSMKRAVQFLPQTYNADDGTIEIMCSAGAPVRRYDYDNRQYFSEVLLVTPEACDLTRVNNGAAPVLDTHMTYSVKCVMGTVIEGRIEDGKIYVRVRLSDQPSWQEVKADVLAGNIRNASIGYDVDMYVVTQEAGQIPVYTATQWYITEVSLVPVGADGGAGVRSADQQGRPCILEMAAEEPDQSIETNQGEERMLKDQNGNQVASGGGATSTTTVATAAQEGAQRALGIMTAARKLGISDDVATQMIKDNVTLEAASTRFIDMHAEAQAAERSSVTQTTRNSVGHSSEDPQARIRAMSDGIIATFIPEATVCEESKQYRGMRISDIADELLRAAGMRIERDRVRKLEKASQIRSFMGNSDFSTILGNAANRLLIGGFEVATPTYRKFAARRDFNDFRPQTMIRPTDFPALLPKSEGGEFKAGTVSDNGETRTGFTGGRVLRFTREMLINDDIGAFSDLAIKAGIRASQFENDYMYGIIKNNPTLSDSKTVFHAGHGNLGGAVTLDITGLAALRARMYKQQSRDGVKLNLPVAFLVVGPDLELKARQLQTAVTAAQASNVNPFSGTFEVVVDANITSSTAYYGFASPQFAGALTYGYLFGQDGPRFVMEEDFNTEGLKGRVSHDFAGGFVDYVGADYSVGA